MDLQRLQTSLDTISAAIGGAKIPAKRSAGKSIRKSREHPQDSDSQSQVVRRSSRRLASQSEPQKLPYNDTANNTMSELVEGVEESFDASSASSKNGRTPKRMRPHKPFKVPILKQPRFLSAKQLQAKTPPKGSPQRGPLVDVSDDRVNLSPTRGTANKNYQVAEADRSMLDSDDFEFGSGIFTSTAPTHPDASQLSIATVAWRDGIDHDDTTVDEGGM